MAYQSFPDCPGDSASFAKLAALALPPLAGRSFLDVGCNEGFFCGYASFDAAASVTGIDSNPQSIARARERFPQCRFRVLDWNALLAATADSAGNAASDAADPPDVTENRSDAPESVPGRVDVILCASALHYASDQPALVSALVDRLRPGGLLVLEMGVADMATCRACGHDSEPADGWLTVRRSIDARQFPTWDGLRAMLAPHAWKHMGPSVPQAGDPVPREVFHICRPRPFAVLLTGDPGSGKSTAARRLFPGLRVISGDGVWAAARASADAWPRLHALAASQSNWLRLDILTRRMFESDLWRDYVALVISQAGDGDFVFDGYIPAECRERFARGIEELGWQPLSLDTPAPLHSPNELSRRARVESRKYQLFLSACAAVRNRRR